MWRKDPLVGFYARFSKNADGSANMMKWETGIPGKEGKHQCDSWIMTDNRLILCLNHRLLRTGTDWEGGVYTVLIQFPPDFPTTVSRTLI